MARYAKLVKEAGGAGEVGAGQMAKLAHQLVLTVNIMALLEAWAWRTGSSPRH